MIYADVVVGVRGSSEELTYAVPAKIIPYIKVGSLVTVPVRRRLGKAVVVKLHQRVDSALKEKLREIYAIDKTHPGFGESELAVAEGLAKRYLTNVSDVMFRMLSSLRPVNATPKSVPGKTMYFQGGWEARVAEYQATANRYREALILFPTNAHLENYLRTSRSATETIVLDGTARSRQKIFALKDSAVFLGTVGDCFFPLKHPGLIIVDQPSHIGSRYSSRPFLRADDVAAERSRNEGVDLLVGQPVISFSQLRHIQTDRIPLKSPEFPQPEITIASRLGSQELLLDSLKEVLADSINAKNPTLLFVASKGWSSGVYCRNCQYLLECSECGRVIGADQGGLRCRYCGFAKRKPNTCPRCRTAELVELGEGVDRFVEEIKHSFPQASLQVVAGAAKEARAGVDVTVATEKILSFPGFTFDTLIVASADRALAGSVLDDSWKLLSTLRELSYRAKSVIVQTFLPDHPVWSALNPENLKGYFAAELSARRRYRLPPYAESLKLVGQYPAEAKLLEQITSLEEILAKKLPTVEYSVHLQSPGPAPGFQAELNLIIPLSVRNLAVNILAEAIEPNWAAIPG